MGGKQTSGPIPKRDSGLEVQPLGAGLIVRRSSRRVENATGANACLKVLRISGIEEILGPRDALSVGVRADDLFQELPGARQRRPAEAGRLSRDKLFYQRARSSSARIICDWRSI